jgi:hypothetical protein
LIPVPGSLLAHYFAIISIDKTMIMMAKERDTMIRRAGHVN